MGLAGRENKYDEKKKKRRGGCQGPAIQTHSQTQNKKKRKDTQKERKVKAQRQKVDKII